MQIIIYGSLYGSTKRYAEHLSEITGIEAVSFKDAKDIAKYDRIIYMGALFAGSVLGLRKTASRMSVGQKLTIITVGMVDPADPENIEYIRRSIKDRVPSHLYDETQIYHLRGAIDYSNLNYGLLGTIIEKVTGERFDQYQKNHILKQLDIKADYLPSNFSQKEFKKLGAVYQKKDNAGVWNEKGPWRATQDGYPQGQPAKDTVALQNPYAENFQDTYSLKDYVPGTNATVFSPAGGLRISCEELSHALSMLLNDGTYKGKQILSPASVKTMLGREWIYDDKTKNGNTYGGTILSYGLGIYQMDGKSTARFCKDTEIDLVGHTGEAFGLLSMLAIRPNTKDGYVYIMNGEAVEEDEDARSAGKFSNNYIWAETLGDAICRNVFVR